MVQDDWLNDWSRSIILFWLNDAIGSTTYHEVKLHSTARTGKAAITDLLAYWPAAILLSLYFTPFRCFLFLIAWLKLIWILFLLSSDRNIFRQFQTCLSYKFGCFLNQLTRSRYSTKWSYWLSPILTKYAAILKNSSIKTKRTAIFNHSLPTVNYLLPRGETLFHLPRIIILEIFKDFSPTARKYPKTFHQKPENFQRLFRCKVVLAANHQHPKIFKDFFACKIVLAANHQLYPGNIQRSSKQQPAAATSSSNQHQQPAVAINTSNQQQQSKAATSSSNQQQQPAVVINSINQQQQSKAATSSSNQQQQPAVVINSINQQPQSTASTSSRNQQHQPAAAINSIEQEQQSTAATPSFRPNSSIDTLHDDLR